MTQKKAIVLVSGGMDSLACIAIAKSQNYDLHFLHLNYKQKTEKKEFESFNKLVNHYQIPQTHLKIVDMSFLSQIGGSSLTDNSIAVSKNTVDQTGIPTSYVPFRNTHILALATSWAEIIGAEKIFIGAVLQDHMGYPDCRPSYYQAFNELIRQGTKAGNITVETPLIHLTKKEILEIIVKNNAPIEKTWSCYERNDQACGVCDSCVLRLRAFQELKMKDPIDYLKS